MCIAGVSKFVAQDKQKIKTTKIGLNTALISSQNFLACNIIYKRKSGNRGAMFTRVICCEL